MPQWLPSQVNLSNFERRVTSLEQMGQVQWASHYSSPFRTVSVKLLFLKYHVGKVSNRLSEPWLPYLFWLLPHKVHSFHQRLLPAISYSTFMFSLCSIFSQHSQSSWLTLTSSYQLLLGLTSCLPPFRLNSSKWQVLTEHLFCAYFGAKVS